MEEGQETAAAATAVELKRETDVHHQSQSDVGEGSLTQDVNYEAANNNNDVPTLTTTNPTNTHNAPNNISNQSNDDGSNNNTETATVPSTAAKTLNYYPTYPANVTSTLARYDSEVIGDDYHERGGQEGYYDIENSSNGDDVEEDDDYDSSSFGGIISQDDENDVGRSEGEGEEQSVTSQDDDNGSRAAAAALDIDTERSDGISDHPEKVVVVVDVDKKQQQQKQEEEKLSSPLFMSEYDENHSASAPSLLETSDERSFKNKGRAAEVDEKKKKTPCLLSSPVEYLHEESTTAILPTGIGWGGDCTATTTSTSLQKLSTSTSTSTASPRTVCPTIMKSFTPIPLHMLPIDALHMTSSYCTPADWAALSRTNKVWNDIGRDVFGKVWRHASRCMFEVGIAWAMGEHADARELASLYISKGVTIYPTPHGHSYHTIAWRMGLELNTGNGEASSSSTNTEGGNEEGGNDANVNAGGNAQGRGNNNAAAAAAAANIMNAELQAELEAEAIVGEALGSGNIVPLDDVDDDQGRNNDVPNAGNVDDDNNNNITADAFYTDRYVEQNHNRPDNHRDSLFSRNHDTYVEEKAMFWKRKNGIEVDSPNPQSRGALFHRRRLSMGNDRTTGALLNQAPRHEAAPQAAAPQPAEAAFDRPPTGLEATATARPQSAVPGPRTQSHATFTAPTFTRRPSLSGESSPNSSFASSPLLSNRNPSTPNLYSLNNTSNGGQPPLPSAPKMSIRIHRHLADQHFFGSPSVNDENGTMNGGKTSLNADFFHPTWERRRDVSSRMDNWDGYRDSIAGLRTVGDAGRMIHNNTANTNEEVATESSDDIGETVDARPRPVLHVGDEESREPTNEPTNQRSLIDSNYRAAVREMVSWTLAYDRQRRTSRGTTRHPLSMSFNPILWSSAAAIGAPSPASDVRLEVYSSTSANLKSDDDADRTASEAVAKMHLRCQHYQHRLDALLKTNFDTFLLQEVLLDYWDEVFPQTAGIHFYNQQSPVPRMSKLHTFLTSPCPKAVGTIQCEIERVTVRNKKRSKRVKGRFFPTYEYRLFIRDTTNGRLNRSPLKDSVLLIAKNKSVKNRNVASNGSGGGGSGSGVAGIDVATPSVLASSTNNVAGNSKRGTTNYFMSLPTQVDVDRHYTSTNRSNNLAKGETSGLSVSPLALQSKDPVEVGRLQSNFIGTDFQIFVPDSDISQPSEQPSTANNVEPVSDMASPEGNRRVHPIERAVAGDATNSSVRNRRASGLVRLARRASSTIGGIRSNRNSGEPIDEESDGRGSKKTKSVRRISWGSPSNTSKRREIEEQLKRKQDIDTSIGEVENGAITYTANLLGNRPRIMDVCIPKLTEDGKVCEQWSGEQQQCTIAAKGPDASTSTMLEFFKTLQQDTLEDVLNSATPNSLEHGLMLLQNRPPWWNVELGAFVLNFGGRVKVASVKNFQLCENADQEHHIMQFGRIEGRHNFTLDFAYPLTPLQAFAVAISSLQSKISFG